MVQNAWLAFLKLQRYTRQRMDQSVLFVSHLVRLLLPAALIGVAHAVLREWRTVVVLAQPRHFPHQKPVSWRPIGRRLAYVVGGLVLGISGWALSIGFLNALVPDGYGPAGGSGIVGAAQSLLGRLGLITVEGLLIASLFLTVSAGAAWLRHTAKAVITATVLFVFLVLGIASWGA